MLQPFLELLLGLLMGRLRAMCQSSGRAGLEDKLG